VPHSTATTWPCWPKRPHCAAWPATGTIFLTLEDETGFINVVVWPRLCEKQRAEILGASILAVDGVLETDGDVHHLIADRVHDFSHLAEGLSTRSRDFC
jgi:error-prone DNA polymerase